MSAQISVIVVSYNVRDLLRECLRAVDPARARGDVEVIVVDNASPDGSAATVRAEFPEVRLVALETNRGFSAAVNAGAREASCTALLLLNPDTRLAATSFPRMRDALGDAAIVGFRQVDERGRPQLACGPEPGFASELFRRIVQSRADRGDRLVGWLHDRVLAKRGEVAWVAGSSMLIRRAAFDRVGGFDEGFFLYFEDIDFCLRVRGVGGRVVFDPSITVLHHRGASMATAKPAAARAYRESQLRFWEKHRGVRARQILALYLRARHLTPADGAMRSSERSARTREPR